MGGVDRALMLRRLKLEKGTDHVPEELRATAVVGYGLDTYLLMSSSIEAKAVQYILSV